MTFPMRSKMPMASMLTRASSRTLSHNLRGILATPVELQSHPLRSGSAVRLLSATSAWTSGTESWPLDLGRRKRLRRAALDGATLLEIAFGRARSVDRLRARARPRASNSRRPGASPATTSGSAWATLRARFTLNRREGFVAVSRPPAGRPVRLAWDDAAHAIVETSAPTRADARRSRGDRAGSVDAHHRGLARARPPSEKPLSRAAAELRRRTDERVNSMAVCKECGDEADALVSVKVGGQDRRRCAKTAPTGREKRPRSPSRARRSSRT